VDIDWVEKLLATPPLKRDGNNLIYQANGSSEWEDRQRGGAERYADETYEEDPTVGHLFGNFIATGIHDRKAAVLDVGCGLFPDLPHYVAQLGLSRYLAIEPIAEPVTRSYPCMVGVMAEDLPLTDDSFDALILGTTLDHIEGAEAAMSELKRVLKPGGAIFIWQGLTDADVLATSSTLHRLRRGLVGIPLIWGQAAILSYRMHKRRKQFAAGAPIDDIHYRWYSPSTLRDDLRKWGLEVAREIIVPGTNSMFVEARYTALASDASTLPSQSLRVPTTVPSV
jgi:SAM-dependent methyltransferase